MVDADRLPRRGPDAVQDGHRRSDGLAAVIAELAGGGIQAHDRDAAHAAGLERQQVPVVLQQDDGLAGRLEGVGAVRRRAHDGRIQGVVRIVRRVVIHAQAHPGRQDAAGRPVDVGVAHQMQIVGLVQRFDVDVVPAFQVQAGLQREGGGRLVPENIVVVLDDIAHGSAVGNHIAVKAPFVPEHRGQQPGIGRAGNAVDGVVGRHDGLRLSPADAGFEGRKIVLPHLLFADDGIALETVVFLVVRREMLRGGNDFQVAGIPRHIHRRRPKGQEVAVLGRLLLSAFQFIPAGPRLIGNHAGDALQQGLVPVIVFVDPHPRNARRGNPEQVDLFIDRQRFQQGLHPLADGEGFILPGFGLREGRKRRGQKSRQNSQFSHHSVTRLNTGIFSRSTGTSA